MDGLSEGGVDGLSEASGVQKTAGDVVAEITEAEGDAAQGHRAGR